MQKWNSEYVNATRHVQDVVQCSGIWAGSEQIC